jgi:hypothetical protein
MFELGAFANARESIYKKKGSFDKWLRKRMDIGEKPNDRAKVCDMIATNLNVYASDKKYIIITGSAVIDEKKKLIEDLRVRNQDITFEPCDSITNNAEDRNKLGNADGIIFFEKYGISRYRDMDREVIIAQGAGIAVVGYVVE